MTKRKGTKNKNAENAQKIVFLWGWEKWIVPNMGIILDTRKTLPSAQEKSQDGKHVFCISLISCDALHDQKKYSQICIPNVILFSGMEPRKEPGKYKLHDLKNILKIYFLSGLGLHDQKKIIWEFIWKYFFEVVIFDDFKKGFSLHIRPL